VTSAANGGQVLLSDAARRALDGPTPGVGIRLLDLGRHRLKDVGVERLWQVEIDDVPTDPRPPRSLERHPSNLPAPVAAMVDRDTERADVAAAIGQARLVTLTGPGGIGKSSVALAVARDLLPAYPDGVAMADASVTATPDTLASALATALGLEPDPSGAASATLTEQMRDREALLLIETVDAMPALVAWLAGALTRCSRLRILCTSRSPLRIAGEREIAIGPLLPTAATELFTLRAAALDPGRAMSPADLVAIAAICERLDGIPLAIELIAARARLLSPRAMLDRLAHRLPLLTGGSVDAPMRQRRLVDTIAWSYDIASGGEQALLDRLSLCVGAFDLATAEALGAAPPSIGDVLGALEGLVERSLVVRPPVTAEPPDEGAEPRFRLLGVIREFALDKLDGSGQRSAMEAAAFDHWLALAEAAAGRIDTGDDAALRRVASVIDDLRWALAWAAAAPDRCALQLRLAAALGPYWYRRGEALEGAAHLEGALATGRDVPDGVLADAQFWAGVLNDELHRPGRAMECLEGSLAARRRAGDERGIARTLNSLGLAARSAGMAARARDLLAESARRWRRIGDVRGLASVLTNLAVVSLDAGDLPAARALLEEAIDTERGVRAAPHPTVLLDLGAVLVRLGELEDGRALLLDALRAFASIGDAPTVAECLRELAVAEADRWDPLTLLRILAAASALMERSGIPEDSESISRVAPIASRTRAAVSEAEASLAIAEGGAMGAQDAATAAMRAVERSGSG
jgi:predicted ATPase